VKTAARKNATVMEAQFANRYEGGQFLAERLSHLANNREVVVLALPRGGVPVGYEIAKKLNAPLDVFIVRKLGLPFHEELAMGAIASGGIQVLNLDVIRQLQISSGILEATAAAEQRELERRERAYRRGRNPLGIAGRTVIVVDDGLATGASMSAAVRALHGKDPARIIVAVPVGAAETCDRLNSEADELICGIKPNPFGAIGLWYKDFTQTTDAEVCELLDRLAPPGR